MGENDIQMESTEQMQEPHASTSDKIDLSLDDIIKLNKKEQKANRAANRAKTKRAVNRNNVLKKLHQVPQQQRGLRRGAQQYQGKHLILKGAFSTRGQRGGRPFVLDRGFAATKRAEKLQKYQTIRRKTSNQTRRGGAVLRGRSSRGASTSSLQGIHLQFNYKATTNQTAVYLNDRFTDLRLRGQGRGRGRGRGAVGEGGRGGGRGNIVGGGQGRGQGNIGGVRGRGRGNFMRGGRDRGRGRGNFMRGGRDRGRGNIMGGGRGRGGVGVTRGGRGLRRGRGGSRGADRTVTLQ
ncbi:hypothetical protein cypCar_00000337 [Cyprinus carpio]|nr:hypothetical protein cypCar_00000337 [Cyprinus carpio]